MRRPSQRKIRERTADELTDLAERATYKGSPEHKDKRWWKGLPEGRQLPGGQVGRPGKQTTTICPLTSEDDRKRATEWVRLAIRLGQCRFYESDQSYPKKIWHKADGQLWMGVLVNSRLGHYKGWPISHEERDEVFR